MKTYKVVGTAPILDHQPGETFEQSIPADLEKYLIAIGGLAVVEEKAAEEPKANKSAYRF